MSINAIWIVGLILIAMGMVIFGLATWLLRVYCDSYNQLRESRRELVETYLQYILVLRIYRDLLKLKKNPIYSWLEAVQNGDTENYRDPVEWRGDGP